MAPPEDPCPICYEPCRIAVSVGRCRHAICSECCENIFSHPGAANRCPLCRLPMNRGTLSVVYEEAGPPPAAAAAESAAPPVPTKLRRLAAHLGEVFAAADDSKVLVFTHWDTGAIVETLRRAHPEVPVERIAGSMPLSGRAAAIRRFNEAPGKAVFVLNLRSGAVGLNLTSANHVVLLEPSMCPGVREQAIGRVFRLGQTRAVHVHHYFMRNTIEEQIFRQRGVRPGRRRCRSWRGV